MADRSFSGAAKGAGKDKGGSGGKHREPKTWGGSKPPKMPKGGGKHAKGGKDSGKGKGGWFW